MNHRWRNNRKHQLEPHDPWPKQIGNVCRGWYESPAAAPRGSCCEVAVATPGNLTLISIAAGYFAHYSFMSKHEVGVRSFLLGELLGGGASVCSTEEHFLCPTEKLLLKTSYKLLAS